MSEVDNETQMVILTSELNYLFAEVQTLYNLSNEVIKDKSKLQTFRIRFNRIETTRTSFRELNSQINTLKLKAKPKTEIDMNKMSSFDDLYYHILSVAEDVNPLPAASHTSVQPSQPNDLKPCQARLPKLELPKFDSKLENWQTFYDTFLTLVHKNNSLSSIEKYHYLVSCLSGSALTIAKGLPITAENYKIVLDTLVDRFQNHRVLASNYLEKICNFPPIRQLNFYELSKLTNTLYESVNALKAMNIDNLGEFILFYLASRALDIDTRKRFETQNTSKIPTFQQLLKFLQDYLKILETSDPKLSISESQPTRPSASKLNFNKNNNQRFNNFQNNINLQSTSNVSNDNNNLQSSNNNNCVCCGMSHALYGCPTFKNLSLEHKFNFVNEKRLCTNCLKNNHETTNCKSRRTCMICGLSHHTYLHSPTAPPGATCAPPAATSASTSAHVGSSRALVLLGTCVVRVRTARGYTQTARALIDSGAQDCFITSACASRLGLPLRRCNLSVAGLGQNTVHTVKGVTSCRILPINSDDHKFDIQPIVMQQITSKMPTTQLSPAIRNFYKHLVLADNDFDKPSEIDLLLGAELFHEIYDGQRVSPGPELPVAMHSIFGWILSGRLDPCCRPPSTVSSLVASTSRLDEVVKRFWEVEEPPVSPIAVPEDDQCEQLYRQLVTRDQTGRYVVPILLKSEQILGSSYEHAVSRLANIEKRLSRQPALREDYISFMREYEALSHMHKSTDRGRYFIPHHCVIRPESTTTRVRVVFDASARSSNGISLNDIVYKGPKLHIDIVDIITKFRLHSVVFTADICKMYRQILIRVEDRPWQHVLWRNSSSEPVQDYELDTVTYGVSSSPYLAMRTLRQLAEEEGAEYPRASEVLRKEIFMDDITTGAPSIEAAKALKNELVDLLSRGQFQLRKWSTNCPEVLADTPREHCQTPISFSDVNDECKIKILGIQWDPSKDNFIYTTTKLNLTNTKRGILSNVARIFDPLGWLTPVVLLSKLILQDLWRLELGWDDPVPNEIGNQWNEFCSELQNLNLIKLTRLVIPREAVNFQLIGFCDGSSKAYGCCVYLRVVTPRSISVNMLIAKSKVAPLKVLTVNRLELCGAVLLARVLSHMRQLLDDQIKISETIAFTDSSTVLAWLNTEPHKLKTFVAHRVVKINDTVSSSSWRHVSTTDNPADHCSRGLSCSQLADCQQWWSGPSWLSDAQDSWPPGLFRSSTDVTVPELKTTCYLSHTTNKHASYLITNLINYFSNFHNLQRGLAWWLRYLSNLKLSVNLRIKTKLTLTELNNALTILVKHEQANYFSCEMQQINDGKSCNRPLQKLSPFIDSQKILRVGGRIKHASLPMNALHPILIPKKSNLAILIIDHYHKTYLHCGPRTLQSLIQRKYWIIGIRNLIRSRLAKCVTCFKVKPIPCQPQMGDLPAIRLEAGRCFQNVGIDFGGPFIIKESRRRNARTYKTYVCLIVCLSVKAVHFELVTELSTEAFIAALDRFTSRRGQCQSIISDCGTNFIGARRYLGELYTMLEKQNKSITNSLLNRKIIWKTNPPGAPHFGGIFESGIKSVKYHLKRVIGSQILTYEEFSTVLTKVEAVLNSRPLCALSSDPSEVDVLTAGHFLVGGPLVSLPEPHVADEKLPLRSRWQLLQKLTQSFWQVWQRDYLHTLQQRVKWFASSQNEPKLGDIVSVVEPNLPPLEWRLGRVEKIHPGQDKKTRVVTVRTASGFSLLRPVVKICPLPINN